MTERHGSIDYLDGPASEGPVPLLDTSQALDVLQAAKRVAIVGASSEPWRASNSVMAYLLAHGYECVPINPNRTLVLGHSCYPTLEAAIAATGGEPFDIVDVFRRPEFTPAVAHAAVATGCGVLWLQQRVINWDAARIAHEGGLPVVMDRCTAIDHRRLGARSA